MLRDCLMILSLVFASGFAAAETGWQSDAFGLYRSGSDPVRDRWAGLRVSDGQHTRIQPGAAVDILLMAGPKSQPAGKDRVHLVTLALDALGNLVADGSAVQIATGQNRTVTRPTQGGIAALLHDPGPRAGMFVAGAQTDAAQSLRALYRVTADLGSIAPQLAPIPVLQAETTVALTLPRLQDSYGNPVEDGTALTLWITDDAGHGGWIGAETLSGDGMARFLIRDLTGPLAIRAQLGDAVSPVRDAETRALDMQGALAIRREPLPEIGAQRLTLGPFRTRAGHLLHDGSAIRIGVTTRDGPPRVHDTWLQNGKASVILPFAQDTDFSLTVQSALGTVRLNQSAFTGPTEGAQ